MKKLYINPEMEVIKIETQQVLALSTADDFTSGDPVLGRDFGDDDDDWE